MFIINITKYELPVLIAVSRNILSKSSFTIKKDAQGIAKWLSGNKGLS